MGWATGEISIWNQTDRDLSDVFPLHKSEITILRFSSNGSRLLTGDTVRNRYSHHHHSTFACLFSKYPDDFAFQSGLLVMWKLDQKGRVSQSPVCQHHCGDQILECVLRPPPPVDPAQYVCENASTLYIHSFNMVITRCSDIAALARAAVSGDESALDMFNWKQKGKTNLKLSGMLGHNEAMTFYIGTQNGKS